MKKLKKIMSFMLVIVLVSSMAFGIDFKTFASTSQTVYFDNSVSKWSNVYAYVWRDGKSATTIKGTKTDTNLYQLTIPEGYKNILFKNTAGTSNWDKQTQDTTIPTDGKNCYKANSTSNKSSGTWSSYTTTTPTPVVTPTPSPNNSTLKRQVKVLVLEINPTLEHPTGGKFGNGKSTITADKYLGLDASESISFLKDNLEEVSHGNVGFDIVNRTRINGFPQYTNGASLTQKDFFDIYPIQSNGLNESRTIADRKKFDKFLNYLTFDYNSLIDDYNLVERKNNGEFDIVWIFGNDPFALYEASMVGKKPFFINGGTYRRNCDNFPILTMTFSRKDGSLEDVGHMAECILTKVFNSKEIYENKIDGTDLSKLTTWEKYVLCKGNAAEGTTVYGVGNVHYSPNSKSDYDWNNQTPVKSYWKDFENGNLDNIGSTVSTFTASTAYQNNHYNNNGDNTVSHHRWWFSCMPHTTGRDENGFSNNWWDYIFTPDYVDTISFTEGKEITMSIGDIQKLSLLLNYYSGNKKEIDLGESEALVSLDNPSVLAYDNGRIAARKSGTATISAKYDGRETSLKITVKQNLKINEIKFANGSTLTKDENAKININVSGGTGSYKYYVYAKSNAHSTEVISNNGTSPTITWTPTKASDTYTLFVEVTDSAGTKAESSIPFVVKNKPLQIKSATIDLGTTFSYGQTATIHVDAAGGDGNYTYSAFAKYDSHVTEYINNGDSNGNLTWTPKAISDSYTVYITVTDTSGASTGTTIDVKVTEASNNMLTIYYGGQNWSNAYIHYKNANGNWTSVPGCQMTSTSEVSGYKWKYTIDLSKDNSNYATVCFNNGNGNWDSKNGSNYQISAGTYGVKDGRVTALGNGNTTPPTTPPSPEPIQSYVTVDFDNKLHKWENVYAYVWNNTEDYKVFSATSVSDYHVLFNITGSYKYILFKNTEDGWDKQTADLVMPAYTSSADGKCFTPYSATNKSEGTWGKSSALTGKKIILPSVSADKNTMAVGDTVNFTMTAQYENGNYQNARYLTFTYEDGTKDTVYSYDTFSTFKKVSGYTYNYSWKPSKTGKVKVTYSVSQYEDHTETSQPIILNVKADSNTVKIYYKNSSWSKANIHYKVNGTWTNVPGVKMEASDRSGYTWMYTIDLGNTTSATLCFNNGNGSWDSKNGSNYTVGTGTYGISNNNTVKLN